VAKKKTKKTVFLLDSSLALAWYFKDEADDYADAVLASVPKAEIVVPALWHLEIANALAMGERRGRSNEAQAGKWLSFLGSLPITMDSETMERAWTDTLALARQHELTVYDAAYLELALRQDLPLASLDDRLKKAAASAGVAEYRP
jgi:predicted nucleic acid-binding protein